MGGMGEPIHESAFMPNWQHLQTQPEAPAIPEPEMDDFWSRRANIAALLEKFKNTGKVAQHLIDIGLFAARTDTTHGER